MKNNDYYRALEVAEDADANQIREAYRKSALKYHPDRNQGDDGAAEKMKLVNEAYAVLSHPDKRRQYDAMRSQFGESARFRFRNAYSEQDIFKGSDIHRVFEEMTRSFGLRGFDEMFREFYGPGFRSFEFRRPGIYTRGFVFTGAARKTGKQPPPLQGPLGKVARLILKKAGLADLSEQGRDVNTDILLTPEQARNGGPYAYFYKQQAKKLVVNIPPGIRSGQKIRLSGLGEKASPEGKTGDLYLTVSIRRPWFVRLKGFFDRLLVR